MKSPRLRELALIALVQFILVGTFFFTLRHRIGPLYENILIEPAGLLQQRPWMDFNGKEFSRGFFPLWNPHTGFGQPHLANLQTAVFYPLNFVAYALGPQLGFELWMFLRLWLGGFFLYLFLRKLKLEALPSLAGSLAWPLGGYGLWFMQLVELNSQILFPVFLILFHNLAEKARRRDFLLIIVTGSIIILGGHPEPIFNSFVLAGLYFIFRLSRQKVSGKEKMGRIILAGSAAVLSTILALLVLLPFFNYVPRCWSLHYPGFGFFHLDIKTIGSLFLPGYGFGNRGPGKILVELLQGGGSAVFKAGYAQTASPGMMPGVGIIAMLLALLGLLRLKKSAPDFSFFTAILVVLLGLTYGIAPFRWMAFLPWFSSASNFKFYFSEIHFCLAVLTGLGLSGIHKHTKTFSSLILVALILSLYLQSLLIKPYLDLGLKNIENQEWLKEIRKAPESKIYRIAFPGDRPALPPNLAMMYDLNDIASSDALFPKAYVSIMEKANGIKDRDLIAYFYPQYFFRLAHDHLRPVELSALGIKWLLYPDEVIVWLGPTNNGEIPDPGIRTLKRIFMDEVYDFRIGLWASISGLIMVCVFWIWGRGNVKKA